MENLKFFLISLVPAIAVIGVSFYAVSFPWPAIITLLVLSFVALFFFSAIRFKEEKKEATISSAVTQTELDSILNNFGDALVIYDENFRILFFNTSAERLFMIPAAEATGSTITPATVDNPKLRIFAQTIFPALAPVMIPRSQTGAWPQIVDLSFSSPQLELRVSTSQLEKKQGQLARFLKVIKNRTHETALLRTKSDFVTVASHQLKTPLTHINWALEALGGDSSLDEGNKEIVKNALSASHLLSEIVESLLNISRIEEGRFGYKFEQSDIVAFVDKVLSTAVPQAERAGIRIYFDKPAEAPRPVFIDQQRLSLAMTNILDNAIRYNVKNGEVTVKVRQMENRPFVEVSVKDTGIGISPEEKEKLFTKFFRAENAVKFQTEGTGLGLYITKNIVEAHGGEVRMDSEINRGTIFYFTLPTEQSLVPQRELPEGL